MTASLDDFNKLDIRVGTIIDVRPFPEAHKPAYKLSIDFGESIGIKNSSAQITDNYKMQDLMHKKVLAVVNFPPRRICKFVSEVLTLGIPDEHSKTILVVPESDVPAGGKLY
jgi:tRNA-binding protein